jgi:hypothetical protein
MKPARPPFHRPDRRRPTKDLEVTQTTHDRLDALRRAVREAPDSALRFADGGEYRIEIPSVEGPAAFEAVLEEADRLGVGVHRVSEGSGVMLLRDDEIEAYAEIGGRRGVEVCLFVGPRAPWNAAASALAPDGRYFGWRHLTVDTLRAAYDDVVRATELGLRSVLIADEGLAVLVAEARRRGELPADLIVKASAILGLANPVGTKVLADIGVDTLNIAGDTPVGELAAFRAAFGAVLDIYVEGPDGLGGFLRYHDIGEITRVAAPVHLKFGLRNAPNIYPSGAHLEAVARSTGIERVRRAAVGLEHLARQRPGAVASPLGADRPGVPVAPATTPPPPTERAAVAAAPTTTEVRR